MKSAVAVLCVFATACAVPVHAQVAGYKDLPKTHWAADSVSHLAAAGILQKAPTKPKSGTASNFDGNKPVTRYEMAVTLYRFVQYIEHANAQGKTKFGADATPIDGPTALKRLIAQGYLPATTPLAKDISKPVTANQFADALAQVIGHSREKSTPLSPDLKGAPIQKPTSSAKG